LCAAVAIFAISLSSADEKQLEDALKKKFEGKVVTLRAFYKEDYLKYDGSGQPEFQADTGPWTVYGRVALADLKLKKDKIEMEGNRALVSWPEDGNGIGRLTHLRSDRILIEVQRNAAHQDESSIQKLLSQVFLSARDNLSEFVPEHWKRFLSGDMQIADRHRQPSRFTAPKPPAPRRVRVSQGVTEGMLVKKVQPEYPALAKAAKLQGDVVFIAVIDTQGVLKVTSVLKPLGMGIEESAMEAVNQWRYRTYLLNGEPVEVETTITVKYMLRP
jgi:TonB family protein